MASDTSKKEALKVTVSVGVAACDESCKNIEVVIDRADRAMYSVKYTGRNRINVWNNGV
jgi:diguanylate cyclase (GGDEF)-like protein